MAAGTLGGVEEEILRFVAQSSPELGLKVLRFGAADALRAALRGGELALGSFENAIELAESPAPSTAELVSAGPSVTLPLAFYSRHLRHLSELERGSRVVVPLDGRSQARALLVLHHSGLLGLDPELGPRARLTDILRNPLELALEPVADSALAAHLASAPLVALGYESAARAGLEPARQALALEDGFSPFAQVLTVRRGDLLRRAGWLRALIEAYRGPAVKDFILRSYRDSVRRAW